VPTASRPPDKRAAQVARQIEDQIIAAGWPVGTSLGVEADLRERFGVGRGVMREAIRLVEHHQVAAMKRGPSGGLVVREPQAEAAVAAMAIFLEHIGTSLDDLMDARMILEPLAAGLAAETINEEGIGRLRAAVGAERSQSLLARISTGTSEVHLILANLSGNLVLSMFVHVLIRLTGRYSRVPSFYDPAAADRIRRDNHHVHDELIAPVIAADRRQAQERAERHLVEIREWMADRTGVSRAAISWMPSMDFVPEASAKMGRLLADQIVDDIVGAGWPVGEVLGSEEEMQARYRVSRGVLREAVRLLESQSVVWGRTGPRGGFFITAPDVEVSVNAMALYLEYRGVGSKDLLVVRNAIELGCFDRVVSRHNDLEVSESLREMRKANDQVAGHDDDAEVPDGFHVRLAQLGGNPVLVAFLEILSNLWGRDADRRPARDDPKAVSRTAKEHHGILDALLDDDPQMARNRMYHHLQATTSWWH
jgi:DNA-binding FadR family transcriptional regulator